jgi:hypothetical protein
MMATVSSLLRRGGFTPAGSNTLRHKSSMSSGTGYWISVSPAKSSPATLSCQRMIPRHNAHHLVGKQWCTIPACGSISDTMARSALCVSNRLTGSA